MIILPAKLSELTGSSRANSTGSSLANSSPGSTQTRQTSNKDTINHVQGSNNKMQGWYAMRDGCGMHMQDVTRNAWTWPQLGNPSVPLERWDEIAWKRYKDHRNRSYGLEMASDSNDTGLQFTASSHLNAMWWACYSTQTWQQNKWPGCIQDA